MKITHLRAKNCVTGTLPAFNLTISKISIIIGVIIHKERGALCQ
jgi:hypothetical protein